MKFVRTTRFKEAYRRLTKEEQDLVKKALTNMGKDLRYPGLRVKKIQGTWDIWEARASRSLRMTFQLEDDLIILRNVGAHDKTLENP